MKRPIYLLDTNVVSEIFKPYPNENVVRKINELLPLCAISSTTWHELIYGVQLHSEGKKKDYLFSFIVNEVQTKFPIINYDIHAAWIHGDLRIRLKDTGRAIGYYDEEIASVAIANQMILVTRNTKHFDCIKELDSVFYMENWFE